MDKRHLSREDWHIPASVSLAFSTRIDGVSVPPYASLNLGLHVGDDKETVLANRARIRQRLHLPEEPAWLEQTHGITVVDADNRQLHSADASYSNQPGRVCAVMTADCLPVLLCDRDGTEVAAVHAGWRGLCDGIIEAALEKFHAPSHELIAYLGPAIGPEAFEVGAEVREAFVRRHPGASQFFIPFEEKYHANLQGLAEYRLVLAGVSEIYRDPRCTFTNHKDFFSFRRDGVTGRMASFIWLNT